MKRFVALLLVFCLFAVALTACAPAEPAQETPSGEPVATPDQTPEAEAPAYPAGTYTATVQSIKGPMTVSVTLSEDAITDVTVVEHCDTEVTADVAIERLTKEIVEKQTVALDTVSGATGTSAALLYGAKTALEQSGADMTALTTRPEAPERTQGQEETFDVVVVGAGGAGLSAAAQAARDSDLNILVLEKLAYTGGSTRYSGGAIWMRGTEYNTEYDFDAQYLIDFMEGRSDSELNEPLLTAVADSIPDTIGYYFEKGIPLNPENGGLGYADSQLYLQSPDNEGAGVADFLAQLCVDSGVEIRTDSPVTSLIIEDGAVVGVNVAGPDSDYAVRADKVILATGGFTQNEDMIEEIAPNFTNNIPFTGPGGTGDGITMTRELNVPIVGEGMMHYKCLDRNYGYYGEIGGLVGLPSALFNLEGQRFCNEKMMYGELTYPLNAQTDKVAFGIVDSTSAADSVEALEKAVELGLIYKVNTLEEAAEVTGMDVEALLASVEKYNADFASGKDDPDFGVPNSKMIPILDAPYYVIPIHPGFIGSIPGLLVNENTEVLNADGEIVPNLYACGELIFGNLFNKFYPASGTGVAFAVYSGGLAGKQVKAVLAE